MSDDKIWCKARYGTGKTWCGLSIRAAWTTLHWDKTTCKDCIKLMTKEAKQKLGLAPMSVPKVKKPKPELDEAKLKEYWRKRDIC